MMQTSSGYSKFVIRVAVDNTHEGNDPNSDTDFLREVADRLRARMSRSAQDIVEIGRELIAVRKRVDEGRFTAWIEAEFQMSRATAYRFISVADTMGTYIASLSETHFGSRVLYALASPDTPDEVRTEITKLAEAGEKVTVADVRAAKTAVVRRSRQNGEVDLAEVRRATDRRTVTTGLMEMLDLFERDDVDPTDRAAFIVAHFDRDMAGKIGRFSIARMNRAIKAMIPVLQAIHR